MNEDGRDHDQQARAAEKGPNWLGVIIPAVGDIGDGFDLVRRFQTQTRDECAPEYQRDETDGNRQIKGKSPLSVKETQTEWDDQIDENGSDLRGVRNGHSGVDIALFVVIGSDDASQRRTDERLEKTIDSPNECHQIDGRIEDRHEQITQDGAAESRADQRNGR